jgi:hypothetical protein
MQKRQETKAKPDGSEATAKNSSRIPGQRANHSTANRFFFLRLRSVIPSPRDIPISPQNSSWFAAAVYDRRIFKDSRFDRRSQNAAAGLLQRSHSVRISIK